MSILLYAESTDHTLAIIESYYSLYEKKDVMLHVFTQSDSGIYDGMNKGIAVARGEIIGFLNADDFFASDRVLEFVTWGFSYPSGVEIIYANVRYVTSTFKPLRVLNGRPYTKHAFEAGLHPPHPSFYVKRDLFKRYGGFALEYKIAADYELMLRFLQKYKQKSLYIDECFVNMRTGGVSNRNLVNIFIANLECLKAWRANFPGFFYANLSPFFILLKLARKVQEKCYCIIKNLLSSGGGGHNLSPKSPALFSLDSKGAFTHPQILIGAISNIFCPTPGKRVGYEA